MITKKEPRHMWKDGSSCAFDPDYKNDRFYRNSKIKYEYTFVLVVNDEHLQGDVGGRYMNWTFNMKQTLKRLKRMLRCRNLKVKYQLEKV